jgi:dTDP-4-dehydrorhamnose 3,5-epimerase
MDDSKFLIIGAKGQLGIALSEKYPRAKAVDSDELDITNEESVSSFDFSGTDTILNVAAFTNVDSAETDDGRRSAWAVNTHGVASLAKVARDRSMTLVHISTDYVFDGSKTPHLETEPFSPLSVYGASKAAGDIVAASLDEHYILRTSWVIGEGQNFVRTMMSLAEKNISPKVVHDQIGRLTFTSELVRAISHLLEKKAEFGTYNVTNSGEPASWADITRKIFAELGRDDLTVTNTTTDEYFGGKEAVAPRPPDSVMDLSKMENLGFKFRDWQEDLVRYVKKERN